MTSTSYLIMRICSVSTLFLTLFVTGCLYIPPLGEQSSKEEFEKNIAALKVGTTTRAEIKEHFGKPVHEEGRFLLYGVTQRQGLLLLIGAGASDFIDLGENRQLVFLEFDENEILKRYETEKW